MHMEDLLRNNLILWNKLFDVTVSYELVGQWQKKDMT